MAQPWSPFLDAACGVAQRGQMCDANTFFLLVRAASGFLWHVLLGVKDLTG